MTTCNCRISGMIMDQLEGGDKRVLSLVVAIRRVLNRTEVFKGDLSKSVKDALRKLVAAGTVFDYDGVFSTQRGRAS